MQWLGGFFITGEAARKFAGAKSDETKDGPAE